MSKSGLSLICGLLLTAGPALSQGKSQARENAAPRAVDVSNGMPFVIENAGAQVLESCLLSAANCLETVGAVYASLVTSGASEEVFDQTIGGMASAVVTALDSGVSQMTPAAAADVLDTLADLSFDPRQRRSIAAYAGLMRAGERNGKADFDPFSSSPH